MNLMPRILLLSILLPFGVAAEDNKPSLLQFITNNLSINEVYFSRDNVVTYYHYFARYQTNAAIFVYSTNLNSVKEKDLNVCEAAGYYEDFFWKYYSGQYYTWTNKYVPDNVNNGVISSKYDEYTPLFELKCLGVAWIDPGRVNWKSNSFSYKFRDKGFSDGRFKFENNKIMGAEVDSSEDNRIISTVIYDYSKVVDDHYNLPFSFKRYGRRPDIGPTNVYVGKTTINSIVISNQLLDKKYFMFESFKQPRIFERFWLHGTNVLYLDSRTGKVRKVLAPDDPSIVK